MDCAARIAACRNRDDRRRRVHHQRRPDEDRHPIVHRRDRKVHYIDAVVGATAVVIRTGGRVVGVGCHAGVDDY